MSSTSLVRSGYSRDWDSDGRRRRGGGFSRFLLAVAIGVGSTLAWQSYGDAIREKVADAYPQLAWLAPRDAAAQPVSTGSAGVARSTDQQLQELSLGLAAMRQRVEQLSLQVSSSQDQLTRDLVAKMQASERDILDKIAAQPRLDVTAARKPGAQTQSTQLH
jgi:hypothetical protein